MELLPQIRTCVPGCTTRKPDQLRLKPVYVSCSQANLTLDDEQGQVVNSDWREFRAKLVAAERSVATQKRPADPYSFMGQDFKWAHTVPEPEKGCLLVATEKLDKSHTYKRTVILLLSTNSTAQTGIILNRPSFMSITELKSLASNIPSQLSDRLLFFGGPLFEGLFLANTNEGGCGAFDVVVKGVHYGAMESLDFEDANERELGNLRFFDGYCSWERDELREEIRAGYWTVAACSPNIIGLNSVGLWHVVKELMGHRVC